MQWRPFRVRSSYIFQSRCPHILFLGGLDISYTDARHTRHQSFARHGKCLRDPSKEHADLGPISDGIVDRVISAIVPHIKAMESSLVKQITVSLASKVLETYHGYLPRSQPSKSFEDLRDESTEYAIQGHRKHKDADDEVW